MPAASLNQLSCALPALYASAKALLEFGLVLLFSRVLQFDLLAPTTFAVRTRASSSGARF
jgi:hypothetical protein